MKLSRNGNSHVPILRVIPPRSSTLITTILILAVLLNVLIIIVGHSTLWVLTTRHFRALAKDLSFTESLDPVSPREIPEPESREGDLQL